MFDKNYPNRKDHRKPYHKVGKHDRSCRPHGSCPWCERNRLHSSYRAALIAREKVTSEVNECYSPS